jgi:uncharacterized cupin superfamily protein
VGPYATGVKAFNLYGDEWDEIEDRDGWRKTGTRVGKKLNAELIGASLYELDPGNRLFPYHTHHANEEWLLVVSGHATVRSTNGDQELREGDIVCFRRGRDGFHQVSNNTDGPIRILMISTLITPEIVEYHDSHKIGVRDAEGERIVLSRLGPQLDYWEGED